MLHAFPLFSTNRARDSFQHLQQELDASFKQFRNGLMATQGALSLNIWQKEGEILARLELPGVAEEDIEIDVHKNEISIKGLRRKPEESNGEGIRAERRGGELSRVLQLPFEVDPTKTEARLQNGILEIRAFANVANGPTRVPVLPENSSEAHD